MSKISNFINSVLKTTGDSGANFKLTYPTSSQLKSNSPLGNQQAINYLTTQLQDDKKPKPVSENQTRYPAYELSIILPPGKKAIPYGALEINVIKHIFKQQGINISNGAAEAIAEKAKLDFTPKWDASQQKYVHNDRDGLYYRDSSFGKNSDMVLAGKKTNANGIEFNGYKFPISSDLQASILAEKDFALDVTKNGGKAFLEKTFNERFGMTLDKALADLPADVREKLKQIDAKTMLSAMMVGGVAIAALKKLPSRAVAVLAAGLTLKDIIQYGAEANHIADKIGQSTKPGDLPVEELKALITNGGLDILLAGVGYAGVKLAPKFAKLGDDALKLTDDVARKFDDAFEKTKGKLGDLANKVDDALSPGMVTTEGIVIKPKQIKGSDVLEMRAKQEAASGRRNLDSHEGISGVQEGKQIGHTKLKHVGKSERWLQDRVRREGVESASSFYNDSVGNRTVGKFIKENKEAINQWLKSDTGKPFKATIDMEEGIGLVVNKSKKGTPLGAQEATKATIILAKDKSEWGWHLLTVELYK
jgi:hypothetical protein